MDQLLFQLAHVAIPAPRFEETRAFYRLLGAREGFIRQGPDGQPSLLQMWFGESFVELIRPDPGEFAQRAKGHFALRTVDIGAAFDFLKRAGIALGDAVPRKGESGVMWFIATDPSGNSVEIVAPSEGT